MGTKKKAYHLFLSCKPFGNCVKVTVEFKLDSLFAEWFQEVSIGKKGRVLLMGHYGVDIF
jgi:hypothetical protein